MKKRTYSDDERAASLLALRANAGNVERTATELGLPRKTLADWAHGRSAAAGRAAEDRHQKKGTLIDILEAWVGRLVALEPAPNTPVDRVAVAVGITIDKLLLLRGQPTSITWEGTGTDLSRLTVDELRTLVELHEKAAGTAPAVVDLPPPDPDRDTPPNGFDAD